MFASRGKEERSSALGPRAFDSAVVRETWIANHVPPPAAATQRTAAKTQLKWGEDRACLG
jgi:hypothetical protein